MAACTLRPKVLLFDKPTSAFDPELVGKVLLVVKQPGRNGMPPIVVTREAGKS